MKSVTWCHWQSHVVMFGISANAWMNLVVAHEILKMLVWTKACRRYGPPSCQAVLRQACIVYIYTLFLSFVPLIPSLPIKTGSVMGVGCIPAQYDGLSTLFLYAVYAPLLVGIPLVYVLWVAYKVWRRDLFLQESSDGCRARILFIYFARIVVVFVLLWLPSLVFFFTFDVSPWARVFFTNLAHLQASVSAAFYLRKHDVLEAFKNTFLAGCCVRKSTPSGEGTPERENTDVEVNDPCATNGIEEDKS